MKKFQVFGAATQEESSREREHKALARRAAAEGFVLLKNDGALPLATNKIALYGPGSRMTVKGGCGSGDVRERHSVTIEEGLINAGFLFVSTLWMDRFAEKYVADLDVWRRQVEEAIKGYGPFRTMDMFHKIAEHPMPYPACTPVLPDELTQKTDIAVYVLSRQAGEGVDRRVEPGDYLLSDVEKESLKILSEHYNKLILILNCGAVVDLSILDEVRIDAVLLYGQGGMEGGNALADVLCGKVSPCGKLTDTWAYHYEDYPSANTFGHRNGDLDREDYSEGIYMGYRWFTTQGISSRYPFGYGLSYTRFSVKMIECRVQNTCVDIRIQVKNEEPEYNGREVVQLYLHKPPRALGCEDITLVAFAKTKLLSPGQCQTLYLSFDLKDSADYDEARCAFVLEKGEYFLLLGSDVEHTFPVASVTLEDEQLVEKAAPVGTKLLNEFYYKPTAKVETLIETLSDKEKIMLVTGGGYSIKCYNNVMGAAGRSCTHLLKKGIPNIVLADGPAGLNVNQSTVIMKDGTPRYPDGLPADWRWGWLKNIEWLVRAKQGAGRPVYRYMTAWPNSTVQAQSWDIALLEEIGCAVGREMLEIGVSVWLAPGMNLHRNPLCGRNFEYYSEDPLISGKMAAAITRGVQSQGGVGVSIKHFCCNNQEDNRTSVSAEVSERALRELYLRAFRIAVEEGKPWMVMSSYNKVNGTFVFANYELLTRILRQEWGFQGLVISDWNATDKGSHSEAINAGNDLIMPGNKAVRRALKKALRTGDLDRKALDTSAGRVLELIFKSKTCEDF